MARLRRSAGGSRRAAEAEALAEIQQRRRLKKRKKAGKLLQRKLFTSSNLCRLQSYYQAAEAATGENIECQPRLAFYNLPWVLIDVMSLAC